MSVRSYEPLERKLVYNCCFKNVKSIFLLLFLFISSCKPLQHNIYILHWTSKKMSQWWIKYVQHIFIHHSTIIVTTPQLQLPSYCVLSGPTSSVLQCEYLTLDLKCFKCPVLRTLNWNAIICLMFYVLFFCNPLCLNSQYQTSFNVFIFLNISAYICHKLIIHSI